VGNRCPSATNDLNDPNDLLGTSCDNKDNKDIKDTGTLFTPPPFQDYLCKGGKKEQVLAYLYNKVKSTAEIDAALNFILDTTRKVVQRNSELFELDHKELNKKFGNYL